MLRVKKQKKIYQQKLTKRKVTLISDEIDSKDKSVIKYSGQLLASPISIFPFFHHNRTLLLFSYPLSTVRLRGM